MNSDTAMDATLADILLTSTVVALRVCRPGPDAIITHQACQHVPYGYFGQPVSRCWSRWSDGAVTHSDSIAEPFRMPHGMMFMTREVNIGCDEDMLPPADLKWFETSALRDADTVVTP